MTEQRQPQDADDQREYGGEPVGQADEEQARREELEYGDSSTAVSPDTQTSDPGAAEDLGATDGLSSRGASADDGLRPPGTADEDRNPDQTDVFAGTTDGDQDAEPPTSGYGEQPEVVSGDDVDGGSAGRASYGDEQDAAPSPGPYQQQ